MPDESPASIKSDSHLLKNSRIISSLLENPTPAGMMYTLCLPKIAAEEEARRWYFPSHPRLFCLHVRNAGRRRCCSQKLYFFIFLKKSALPDCNICQKNGWCDWLHSGQIYYLFQTLIFLPTETSFHFSRLYSNCNLKWYTHTQKKNNPNWAVENSKKKKGKENKEEALLYEVVSGLSFQSLHHVKDLFLVVWASVLEQYHKMLLTPLGFRKGLLP